LGYRENGKGPYVWMKYSEVIEQTRAVGSGMINKGIEPKNSTNIAIYSRNCAQWNIAEYACYTYSMNIVSLYDIYGRDEIKYMLKKAEIRAVFVDNFERLANILHGRHELPYLRLIVYFERIPEQQINSLSCPKTIEIISFEDLIDNGENILSAPIPPKPSDNATICFTSGTTGQPKGAIITHGNIISNDAAMHILRHRPHLSQLGLNGYEPTPVHYSFLPLAHMIERMTTFMVLTRGGCVGYISGDIMSLFEDCQLLKPTNLSLVPRILNKLHDRVMNEIGENAAKRLLVNRGVERKESDRKNGVFNGDTIYDKLIFKKIRNLFGGNVIRSGTGSAPISSDIKKFATAVFNCPIPEAYGQTEATLSITYCHPLEPELGHCGAPIECVMVKLVDVPEMNYFAKDMKGEICAKGPSVFKGYYKDPEKTAEAIDQHGWLHTGDIGMWLPNGTLKIIDRKKHIFKLSRGEYIAPERVESAYLRSLFISQIFIDGDSYEDFVVAIVVPDEEYLAKYCKQNKMNGTFKELCQDENMRRIIFNDMEKCALNHGLFSHEKVKNIYLHSEQFNLENDFVTPTLKLRRINLRSYFKQIMQNLYKEARSRKARV